MKVACVGPVVSNNISIIVNDSQVMIFYTFINHNDALFADMHHA
jgi:hypothetical protein